MPNHLTTVIPIFSQEDSDLAKIQWWIGNHGYALFKTQRELRLQNKKSQIIYAHRVVLSRMLGRQLETSEVCDHINRNTSDNRRENLRLSDKSLNGHNWKPRKTKSGIRGINHCLRANRKPWEARIVFRGKRFWSAHDTKEEAIAKLNELRLSFGLPPVDMTYAT